MRNVTISMDEELARWARVEAARRDTSVSQMLAGLLRSLMLESQAYEAAEEQYLGRDAQGWQHGGPYPGREELHDRAGLR
jgi:hypothetical protein